eukprot:7776087-Pyramimonas_sp.AAC.1
MYYTHIGAAHSSAAHVWRREAARSFVKAAIRTSQLGATAPSRAPLGTWCAGRARPGKRVGSS